MNKTVEVTKFKAAESQLSSAIRLMFEDRDVISAHTLACAAMVILHEHMTKEDAYKASSMLHYDNINVKEECRDEYYKTVKKSCNFFKHADRDLKKGSHSINFIVEGNTAVIFEAWNCLKYVFPDEYRVLPEFVVFLAYFIAKNPKVLTDEFRKKSNALYPGNQLKEKAFYLQQILKMYLDSTEFS